MPTKRICDLFGDEEAVIEGVVRSATSRRRGRLRILTARVADETGEIRATWFNQPWLEAKLVPGTAAPHSRPREPARLRGLLVRPRRRGRDRRLRARLPRDRGRRAEEAPRPPCAGARPSSRRRRGSACGAARLGAAADPGGRALRRFTARDRSRRPRSDASRLAFDELLVLRLALLRTRRCARQRVRAAARRAG